MPTPALFARVWFCLFAINLAALPPQGASAQEPGTAGKADAGDSAADAADAGALTTTAEASRVVYFDLGDFHVRELRPTRNETADVRFSLQLELPPTISERTRESLSHMQHRLRDQVIVAVRLSSSSEFAEPRLERLQSTILRRVNRILVGLRIESLYLTQFSAAGI